ncbi:MAG: hypothetical protein HFG74_08535 [Hungatella sp.]|nr:hypothetical protein [Hungatella sp.]
MKKGYCRYGAREYRVHEGKAAESGDVFWANNYSYMVLGTCFTYSNMPSFLETVVEMALSDAEHECIHFFIDTAKRLDYN